MLFDEDQRVPGFPEVAILSNEKVDGKFIGVVAAGDFWHSDQSYRRETSLATLLYVHKLPKHGGDISTSASSSMVVILDFSPILQGHRTTRSPYSIDETWDNHLYC